MEGLFAGTPPLEALRALISEASTLDTDEAKVIEVDDVSRAFFEADMQRSVCIELPEEDPMHACGEWVGQLQKALYGTRDAPQVWLEELGSTLQDMGFKASLHLPGLYYHKGREVMMVKHVDDLLCSGTETRSGCVKRFAKGTRSRAISWGRGILRSSSWDETLGGARRVLLGS